MVGDTSLFLPNIQQQEEVGVVGGNNNHHDHDYYYHTYDNQQHQQQQPYNRLQQHDYYYYDNNNNNNRPQVYYYHHSHRAPHPRQQQHRQQHHSNAVVGSNTIEEVNVGRHCWHVDAETMGTLSDDLHTFTKLEYEGRLSMVTEEQIRRHGVHRYMISFDSGEISPADGVGYAFSSQLPCKKNIQKIDSIFLNRRGHICSRTHSDVSRRHAFVAPLELGRVVDITVDVDRCLIYFGVWAPPPPQSHNNNRPVAVKLTPEYIINNYHLLACATVEFGDVAATCRYGSTGHFCTVLKNTNVTVSFICPDKKQ
ncbi:hypothetical protein FOZ60_005085 [Perkinsus olseni]|uniref:Uncharacterized protein n=1 Tax=Perkinsus olseni TaxID=32597 RepID=A0A7J6NSN1_PEROL|nr:hypothetical protein FOZ60_005085 [Perkinsus olseni]